MSHSSPSPGPTEGHSPAALLPPPNVDTVAVDGVPLLDVPPHELSRLLERNGKSDAVDLSSASKIFRAAFLLLETFPGNGPDSEFNADAKLFAWTSSPFPGNAPLLSLRPDPLATAPPAALDPIDTRGAPPLKRVRTDSTSETPFFVVKASARVSKSAVDSVAALADRFSDPNFTGLLPIAPVQAFPVHAPGVPKLVISFTSPELFNILVNTTYSQRPATRASLQVTTEFGWYMREMSAHTVYINEKYYVEARANHDVIAVLAFVTALHEVAHYIRAELGIVSPPQPIPGRLPAVEAGDVTECAMFGGVMGVRTDEDDEFHVGVLDLLNTANQCMTLSESDISLLHLMTTGHVPFPFTPSFTFTSPPNRADKNHRFLCHEEDHLEDDSDGAGTRHSHQEFKQYVKRDRPSDKKQALPLGFVWRLPSLPWSVYLYPCGFPSIADHRLVRVRDSHCIMVFAFKEPREKAYPFAPNLIRGDPPTGESLACFSLIRINSNQITLKAIFESTRHMNRFRTPKLLSDKSSPSMPKSRNKKSIEKNKEVSKMGPAFDPALGQFSNADISADGKVYLEEIIDDIFGGLKIVEAKQEHFNIEMALGEVPATHAVANLCAKWDAAAQVIDKIRVDYDCSTDPISIDELHAVIGVVKAN
ncbi:hypothetical protein BDK51DRAFT_52620 [Blyttiomyces helicus]|uniref:Uncharacterized protein n=1 Tax=Blyttiomyces helicus TaxID=388810 RepID=A0A4P9WNP0_9FUNG|nr:hypothetical protein BDK51DRAFT_52620 [Blyttiomyces helicus]|eukprot:RKO94751.1 hypothetical protein BDK51DRAFT_52620 [Blyttiomyces helicus]